MGVFTPVAAAPAHPRFAWARTVYPRCKRNAKSPQAPRFAAVAGFAVLPRSLLSQSAAPRANNNRPRRPAFRCRPWSCPASVPIAGNDSRRQARIAEAVGVGRARRRPRRFRGWLCAELSKHQRRGATPAKGGKPSAAVFSANLVGQEKRRARFWAASPPASPRPLAGNPWKARSTHLRQDERTTNRDPRPMGQSGSNFWDEQGTNQSGAGVGSPRSRRWGNATHHANAAKGNAAEPSLGRRAAHFNADPPRRAEGQRQFSPRSGTILAQAPRRGKAELESRWGNANADPKRRRAALLGQRP